MSEADQVEEILRQDSLRNSGDGRRTPQPKFPPDEARRKPGELSPAYINDRAQTPVTGPPPAFREEARDDPRGFGRLRRGEIKPHDPEWQDYDEAIDTGEHGYLPIIDTHIDELERDIARYENDLVRLEEELVELEADLRHWDDHEAQPHSEGHPRHRPRNDDGSRSNAHLQRSRALEHESKYRPLNWSNVNFERQQLVRREQRWLEYEVSRNQGSIETRARRIKEMQETLGRLQDHRDYLEDVDMPSPGTPVPARRGERHLAYRGTRVTDDDMIDRTTIGLVEDTTGAPYRSGLDPGTPRGGMRSQRGRDAREQMQAIAELGDNPLDEFIARDRDGGMTLEEAAKKYGLSREVIRAREIQHRRRKREGGMRSIGGAADRHRRSGAAGRAYRDSFRDDSGAERFLENDVLGDVRNRSLNDLYENDLISPEVDRYINEKLVPEGLGEGDPEWDYIMNEKIDELTMTRLGEKILETIEEDFREGNQDWYRNRFGDGGGGPDPYDERVDEGERGGMRSQLLGENGLVRHDVSWRDRVDEIMWENGLSREAAHSEFEREENAAWAKLTPEQQKQHLDDTAYGVGKNSYHRMSDNLLEWFIRDGEKQLLELEEDLARVLDEGPVDPHGIWRDGEHATYLRGRIADREATLVDEKREWKRREANRLAGGQFVGRTGMRSIRVPAGRRGRGGVRARQREAVTDRVAMPRGREGMRSRRRFERRGQIELGVDRASEQDGQIWEGLDQSQKEAVIEAARFQLNRLMWSMAHNDQPPYAEPTKSGTIVAADGTRRRATGTVKDRSHADEISRVGYQENSSVKDWFDRVVRTDNPDEDEDFFRDYVFSDEEIAQLERVVDDSVRYGDKVKENTKSKFEDIKTLRNMIREFESTGDNDSFAFLEHLNPASRKKIHARASGPERNKMPSRTSAWGDPTTIHASARERQLRAGKLKGRGRRRDTGDRSLAQRIMLPNEARRRRIAAARARAGGAFALPGRRVDPLKPTMQERIETAKRKARRLFRGNPGFAKRDEQIRDNRKHEPLLRSTDRLVQGAGAKRDFPEYEEADRGLPVVTDRFRKNLAALASQRRRLQAGDEAKKKSGDQEKGETVFAGEPDADQLLIDAMYLNFGFMEQPVVVNEQGFADALLNPDALVILRGMGQGATGRKFARAYLDFRGRFIGGKAGQGHGRGDDWARPLDPASGTPGSLYGGYGEGVLAIIDPRHFRIADQAKMVDIQDEHRAIDGAIGKVVSESAEGSSITDVVRKSPPDEIAAKIRRQLDADQADGKLRLPNRTGQRERVHPQGGSNTYDGYRIVSGDSAMEAPWAETETGSIIDQLLTQLADNPTPAIQEEVAEALEMMHILQGLKQDDTFMYLPILGIDGIHRNGGVVKVANRGALTAYSEPVGKAGVKVLMDKHAPGHLAEQVRREQRG